MDSSTEEIETAAETLDWVASEWSLTLNLCKTKLLVADKWSEDDLQPITIRGESTAVVPEFRYLGSLVEAYEEILKDVRDGIARASRVLVHSANQSS